MKTYFIHNKIYNTIFLLLLFMLCFEKETLSQSSDISWSDCYGGSLGDFANCLQPIGENNFVFCGATFSTNVDVVGNHGQKDGWIVKSGLDGNVLWQRCLGGSSDDEIKWAHQNSDGNFLLCGHTYSTDGDITTNKGDSDAWLISVSATGSLLWQQSYGGTYGDFFLKALPTSDGGTIAVGFTFSDDGDVNGLYGSPDSLADAWIIKLDSEGKTQWQRCFGGTDSDAAYDVLVLDNDEYMVAATCLSRDGDATNSKGNRDIWLIRFNSTGAIIAQNNYGGSFDDGVHSILQTADKGFIVAGYSLSDDGDLTGHFSDGISDFEDAWVFCTNSEGEIRWQKNMGGTRSDLFQNVITNEDGYVLTGHSNSLDGELTGGTNGFKDYWVVRVDTLGNKTGQEVLGGPFFDFAFSSSFLPDGSLLCAGFVGSQGGDVLCAKGNSDVWIAQLKPGVLPITCNDLTVEKDGYKNNLYWSCNTNQIDAIYYIEHSADNNHFKSIGIVAGNSGTLYQSYFFSDPAPLKGKNFYRIRTKTINGNELYSNIVTCESRITQSINFFPNPVQRNQDINLVFDKVYSKAVIEWHTMDGKKITKKILPATDRHLLKAPSTKGAYLLTIMLDNNVKHYSIVVL